MFTSEQPASVIVISVNCVCVYRPMYDIRGGHHERCTKMLRAGCFIAWGKKQVSWLINVVGGQKCKLMKSVVFFCLAPVLWALHWRHGRIVLLLVLCTVYWVVVPPVYTRCFMLVTIVLLSF